MNVPVGRILRFAVPAAALLLLAGCGGTKIKSDLVLDGFSQARIDLHQKTKAIDLSNDSDAAVHVSVLDKKNRVVSRLTLDPRERVSLDIMPARALEFDNDNAEQAVLHWTLRNSGTIEYSLAHTAP